MGYLTPDQIPDFVVTTLSTFKKYKWTDLSLEHQEYVSAFLIDEKKVVEQGGKDISFRLQARNTGTARNSGMFAQDRPAVEDVMVSASIPWAKQTCNWSYEIDEDIFQSDRVTIVRELVVREHDALNSMAELQEENLWSSPIDVNDRRPYGIPYWIQKNPTTEPDGGWNGGDPPGHPAGCAGLSSQDYQRWRNYTYGYATVDMDDYVRKTKRAIRRTNFKPPVPHPELAFGKSDYVIYTTEAVCDPLERLAETRNLNLGKDLALYMNSVLIAGVPVKWVPYLDANDQSDPSYGVNWKVFRPFVKKGGHMRRSEPIRAPHQHTVYTVHIDNWMNYACYNRRLLFVGSKAV